MLAFFKILSYALLVFLAVIALVLIIVKLYIKLHLKWNDTRTCLIGKTALVTGGNSGIGYETALYLASRGCRVIIADKDRSEQSKEKIVRATKNKNVKLMYLDLSSFKSVRQFAKKFLNEEERLDILINNAAILGDADKITQDGLNACVQVNHLGPFLLTNLLANLLKQSAPSRVIFVLTYKSLMRIKQNKDFAEVMQSSNQNHFEMYFLTKCFNAIVAAEMAEKLMGFKVSVNCVNTGDANTNMLANMPNRLLGVIGKYFYGPFIAKTAEEGAQTCIYAATAQEGVDKTGDFFDECKPIGMPSFTRDLKLRREVWKLSEELVNMEVEEQLNNDKN